MEQYEVSVVYHPSLEVDLSKAEERVIKTINDAGGKITKTDNWGKRKLAYTIKKEDHGIYVFYTADLPAEGLQKIEKILNITDEVIRYLIVKPDLKAKAKAEAELKKEKKKTSPDAGNGTDDDGKGEE